MSGDLVYQSIELVAEYPGDISVTIYEKYFARCPESEKLMSHLDDIVRGRMMDEVYRLFLIDSYAPEQAYLNWEVKNHQLAYSVEPYMYRNLFDAIVETIREALAEHWNTDFEEAWQKRINALLEEIHQRFANNAKR